MRKIHNNKCNEYQIDGNMIVVFNIVQVVLCVEYDVGNIKPKIRVFVQVVVSMNRRFNKQIVDIVRSRIHERPQHYNSRVNKSIIKPNEKN